MSEVTSQDRWTQIGACPGCRGAVTFHLSAADDWPDELNIRILGPAPTHGQFWECPHCSATHEQIFNGWLGPVTRSGQFRP